MAVSVVLFDWPCHFLSSLIRFYFDFVRTQGDFISGGGGGGGLLQVVCGCGPGGSGLQGLSAVVGLFKQSKVVTWTHRRSAPLVSQTSAPRQTW